MKKTAIATILALWPVVHVAYGAQSNYENAWRPYVMGNIGAVVSDVDIKDDGFFDFGGVTAFEVGAKYNRFRIGLAWQSRAETSEVLQSLVGHTISIKNDALRLNGYYDFVSDGHFSIYIGAGAGVDRYDYTIKNRWPKYSKSEHGASFIGGGSFGMVFSGDNFGVDIGFIIDYISRPDTYSYGPTIGLRYMF